LNHYYTILLQLQAQPRFVCGSYRLFNSQKNSFLWKDISVLLASSSEGEKCPQLSLDLLAVPTREKLTSASSICKCTKQQKTGPTTCQAQHYRFYKILV
jgi:hypothetical protein